MIARTQPTTHDLVRRAATALHSSADRVRQALDPITEFRQSVGAEQVPPEMIRAEGAVQAALAYVRRLTTALAERAVRSPQPQEGANGS